MASISDIGIDLGTSQILIYMKGKGIILREPTVVAIDRDSRDILAFGDEAKRMIGRTPGNILAIRPLREGAISDYELVSFMLKGFVLKAIGKHMFARPRAILALPTAINEMEKRSLISTMFDAGMRRTQLLNRSLAAALGAGHAVGDNGQGAAGGQGAAQRLSPRQEVGALPQVVQVGPVEGRGISRPAQGPQQGGKPLYHQPLPAHLTPVQPVPERPVDG